MIYKLKIVAVVFIVVVGIPTQIIDYKHRKTRAYEPGNVWAYYEGLRKEGNWEGIIMIWSGYAAIVLAIATLGYLFYSLRH
jgi:hypothetical protein